MDFFDLGDVGDLCVSIQSAPGEICIEFPGGATICAQVGYELGDPTAIIQSLFGQVNSALAPLAPLFNVFDIIFAIFKCIKAIPDCIGPPPSPTPILNCMADLVKKINQLLKLIPPLSIPGMIKSTINAVILLLQGLKDQLKAIIDKSLQIIAASTKAAAAGNISLGLIADCAADNLDAQITNLNAGLAPLNRFIGIISAFMQIASLGCIPPFGDIPTDISDAMLEPIDEIIKVLIQIRDAIPDLPQLSLSTGDC